MCSAAALAAAASTAPVAGQDDREAPGPAVRDASGPTITMAHQSAVVAPDGTFSVLLEVADAPAGGDVAIDLYDRITSRRDLARSLTDRPVDALATFETIPVDGDQDEQIVGFTIHLHDRGQPAPEGSGGWAWQLTEPGTYPVRIRLRDADGADVVTRVTYLVRTPAPGDDVPPARVALLAMLTSPAAEGTDGDEDPGLDVAAIDELLGVIDSHPTVPLTLVVDPELLRRTALSTDTATSGGDLAEALSELLERDGVELLGSAYTDLDVAALVEAGLVDAVTDSARLGRSTNESLLGTAGTTTWAVDGRLDVAATRVLTDLGVEHLVVPPTAVVGDPPTVPTPLVGADPALTVLADAAPLPSADHPDPVFAAHHWLGLHTAEATITAGDGTAAVTRIDPATVDLTALDRALTLLADHPDVLRAATISELFEEVEPSTTPIALAMPDGAALDGYAAARGRVLGLASSEAAMHEEPGSNVDERDRAIASTARAGLTDRQRLDGLAEVERDLRATFDAITTPDADRVTLGARNATIPLPVESSATGPLRVRVHLESSNRLDLPKNDFEVVVDPGRTSVPIPVRTLTSGDVPLRVTVTTPDGGIVLSETRYTVRSTVVSGVGIVLTVGAAGFLAVWWGRHLWRSRRGRGDDASDGSPDDGPDRRSGDLALDDDELFVDEDVTLSSPPGSEPI